MIRRFRKTLRQAGVKIFGDFVLIHFAMLAALLVEVLYRTQSGNLPTAAVVQAAAAYYIQCFWALSLLFPAVLWLTGLYGRAAGYSIMRQIRAVLSGSIVGSSAFLTANYMLFRDSMVTRTGTIVFAVFAAAVLVVARLAAALFASRSEAGAGASESAPLAAPRPAVLVVGGAGYIGAALVRRLLASGRRVVVLDKLVYGDGAIRDLLCHPQLELQVGDCRNIQHVVAALRGVDTVVHLAAIVGDPACEQNREMAVEVNYAATRMLIEVAKGARVSRFIFASTCSVYGATDHIMDEESPVQPISLYGRTKVDSERVLKDAESEDFHPVLLRFSTVFGLSYRPRFDLVVNLLTAKAYTDRVITVFNGEQWRPFIHVEDVARGIMAALNAPLNVVSGQIYNVGDNRLNCTLMKLAQKVQQQFPQTRIEHIENSDRRNYRVSFEKIRNELGFECEYTIEEGISEIKRAFHEGRIVDYTDARYSNHKHLKVNVPTANRTELDVRVIAAFGGLYEGGDTEVAAAKAAGF